MAIRVFLISSILFFNFAFCRAQTESIENKLRSFLVEVGEIEKDSEGQLVIRHSLDYTEFNKSNEGIYKFVIVGSHSRPFLFLYENNQVNIIKDYSISAVLNFLVQFFKRNDSVLDQKAKIKYLENVVSVIKKNQNPRGWVDVQEDFQVPDSTKQ